MAEPWFRRRGVVVSVDDLLTLDWPDLASRAGLTSLATHFITDPRFACHHLGGLLRFLASEPGEAFRAACGQHGLAIEHELHVLRDFLPPGLFGTNPTMFRADDNGLREPAGLCIHSPAALECYTEAAVDAAKRLRPTTGRHFFWIDDGRPLCRCRHCRALTDSDQALILENHSLRALRQAVDPAAQLAHLAYAHTLPAPREVTPEPGVFLEFAPYERQWDRPLSGRESGRARSHGELLDALDANLAVFAAGDAQVLEYWLDASLHSGYQRPARAVPWRADVLADDLATYARRGIRCVASFAVFVDGDYVARHGEPQPVLDFGAMLASFTAPGSPSPRPA